MLDPFRKRDNLRPATPSAPSARPLNPTGAQPSPREEPRAEAAPNKAALLDTPTAPASSSTVNPSASGQTAPASSEPGSQPPSAEAQAPGEVLSSARLIVGPQIKLKGAEITDCDTIIVEGEVDASMDSRVVEIAQQGVFRGKVVVDIAEIRGCFEGELTAHKRLVIRETGRVAGKIRYGKVCIDEGGQLSGDVAASDSGQDSSTTGNEPRALGASRTAAAK